MKIFEEERNKTHFDKWNNILKRWTQDIWWYIYKISSNQMLAVYQVRTVKGLTLDSNHWLRSCCSRVWKVFLNNINKWFQGMRCHSYFLGSPANHKFKRPSCIYTMRGIWLSSLLIYPLCPHTMYRFAWFNISFWGLNPDARAEWLWSFNLALGTLSHRKAEEAEVWCHLTFQISTGQESILKSHLAFNTCTGDWY